MKRLLPISMLGALLLMVMQVSAQFSPQKAVIEEFTGNWCGYCPEGASIVDNLANTQSNVIAVAVHDGGSDAMATAQTDTLASFYRPAFPQAIFNRGGQPVSRGSWAGAAVSALSGASSATVSFSSLKWNPGNRIMEATVEVAFTGYLEGDLRLGLMIIEDSVVGSGPGYDQTNYFNTTAGHEFQGRGNPIVNYVHRHVFREAVGSVWGNPGIIQGPVNFGSSVQYTFQKLIPLAWDIDQVHLAAFVSHITNGGGNISDRKIINGEGIHLIPNLTPNTSIDREVNFASDIKVFPNPSDDIVNFAFNLKNNGWIQASIYDQNGREVTQLAEGIMNAGLHTLNWNGNSTSGQNVAPGLYLLKITSGSETLVRRVMRR